MKQLIVVDTGYFCCGLIVDNGIVVDGAPIMKWAIGKTWDFVRNWIEGKQGTWHIT